MSLVVTCWWTLVRTVVLCLLAWPFCRLIERSLNGVSPAGRPWLMAGLLVPCCFPELLIGYAFRDLAMANPNWAEALCSGMLLLRMIPIGTIALLASPRSGLDASALYCRQMLIRSRFGWRRQRIELARCYWHGPILRALPALALMSIVAFQEFELAALVQTMSWTDWFVTAQRLGLERNEMLRQSLWPLLWQSPVLIGVLYWLRVEPGRRNNFSSATENLDNESSRRVLWLGVAAVSGLLIAGCLIPLGLIGWRTVDGLGLLLRQRPQQLSLAREIATSSAVALCAGLSAWSISGRLKGIAANVLLLGLFGSLLLSLGIVASFQWTWLRPLYDTPIPWVLGLTVWLLPRAAILRMWLHALQSNEAIHVAEMLETSEANGTSGSRGRSALLWRLRDQPQFLAASLLSYWAYCDLPTAYLLAPSGMASGLVRLYNFMHFGRSAALSAEASVFFGVPVVGLFLLLLVKRGFR